MLQDPNSPLSTGICLHLPPHEHLALKIQEALLGLVSLGRQFSPPGCSLLVLGTMEEDMTVQRDPACQGGTREKGLS